MTHRETIHFPHHTLADSEPFGPIQFVGASDATPVDRAYPDDGKQAAGQLHRAGVAEIILVHGTFAGNDVIGMMRELSRFSPRWSHQLRELEKRWFDGWIGELANYAESFAERLSHLINPTGQTPIRVRRFHWSGENHHLGRASAAMSLLDSIADDDLPGDRRLLILAHSHGGNVIAMLSQLLGAPAAARRAFFESTRLHFGSSLLGGRSFQEWQRCEQRLCDDEGWTFPPIDVATFGTPLRYRWNRDVCSKLLHFVQHRPQDADHPERARLPSSINDVINATGGDYVQHIGIAGTDFLPSIFAWRDWVVDRRLNRMFEPTVRHHELIKRLRIGRRASCDGTTLLVDYADCDSGWNRKVFGHGVYTCSGWLPFHLREIAERFYG